MLKKNICEVCNKEQIGLFDKVPFVFGLTIKCGNCKTTYIQSRIAFFEDDFFIIRFFSRLFDFILEMLYLPLLILLVLGFMSSTKYAIIISIFTTVIVVLYLKFIPYRVDESNSLNDRIQRIQKNKNSV